MWSITIHTADAEQGVDTAPYDETAVANLTGLTNYTTSLVEVTGIKEQVDIEGEQIEYASGSLGASQRARKTYTISIPPFSYLSRHTLLNLFFVSGGFPNLAKAKYIWLEFYSSSQGKSTNVGLTGIYMTADYAIPVTLTGANWSHNFDFGTKTLELTFKRKYLLT